MRNSLRKGLVSMFSVLAIGVTATGVCALVVDSEMNPMNAAAAVTAETEKVTGDFVMKMGASVRKEAPTGIRFSTYVKESAYNESYTYGTLVIPKVLLGDAELTEKTEQVDNIEAKVWATNSDVEGYKLYHAVMTGIPTQYYGTELVARSYVIIDGEYRFVDEEQTRSVAQVAASALANGVADSASGVLVQYIDNVVSSLTWDVAGTQTMMAGDTLTLTATATPAYEITWSTSNEEVAIVNGGVVTATGAGTATITAKLGSKTLSCEVEVNARQFNDVGEISINEETGALTWAKVSATDNAEFFADAYEVTVTDEQGAVETYKVSENQYRPYTLAQGVYTASVKAIHSKGYVAPSANASEEYKFVVSRYADYLAANMENEFKSAENGTKVTYNEETGYATISNENDYGLIVSKDGIKLNMTVHPVIVMDTVAANGYMYFKASYSGSDRLEKQDNGKYYMLKDTELGTYEEDRYVVISANKTHENGTLAGEVEDYKIYPGLSQGRNSAMTLRGIYILSVTEYVEAKAEELPALSNFQLKNGVISADKLVSEYAGVDITYTVEVTGNGVDETFENLSAPTVDMTKLSLTAGEVYTVTMMANGDGTYYADSMSVSQQVQYSEAYNVSDFTQASISHRDGSNDVTVSESSILVEAKGRGNYSLNALNIDTTKHRITANSVIKVTFGEVTEDTKFWTGFFKKESGGGDRDTKFEAVVTSNSQYVATDFYKDRGSYVINNMLYFGFGVGGSDREGRKLYITNVTMAEYAFYPCEASTTTEALTFDKSNGADQVIDYTFQNGATLSSVKIDGNSVNYTNNDGAVTISASAISALPYGVHTVTLKDTNGYTINVALTVMNSQAVAFENGYVIWLTDETATEYEVEILGTEYKETVNGTSYPIAEKNLATGQYTVQVTSKNADESTVLGSVTLNIEQLLFWDAEALAVNKDDSSKSTNGAKIKVENGAAKVTANGWGCYNTADLRNGDKDVVISENTYLSYAFGGYNGGYYTQFYQNGDMKWGSGDVKNNNTLIVALGQIDKVIKNSDDYNRAYIKLGTTQADNCYMEYKSINVCNITVVAN